MEEKIIEVCTKALAKEFGDLNVCQTNNEIYVDFNEDTNMGYKITIEVTT